MTLETAGTPAPGPRQAYQPVRLQSSRQDSKALEGRGDPQARVEADEVPAGRVILGPKQRRRELE